MSSEQLITVDLKEERFGLSTSTEISSCTIKCRLVDYVNQRAIYYTGELVKTGAFSLECPDGKNTRWVLEICPRGAGANFLSVVNLDQFDIKAHIAASVLNRSGEKQLTRTYRQTFDKNHKILGINEILASDLNNDSINLIPDGDLTLVLDFTLSYGAGVAKNVNLTTSIGKGYDMVRESFGNLFNSKEMSDVQIKCGDQILDAHQLVLSTRSPVFQRMFQAEMKEKENGQVDIKDLKPEVVSEMLKFIYSWECESIYDRKTSDQEIIDLLAAAEKYQIELLKHLCEDELCTRIKVESSLKFLIVGDWYGAVKLKGVSMELVTVNVVNFMGSEEWKDCLKNRPSLVEDIIKAMSVKKI